MARKTPSSEKISADTAAGPLPWPEAVPVRAVVPGEQVRRAPADPEAPGPRTAHDLYSLLIQLDTLPRVAGAVAVCDVLQPLWARWLGVVRHPGERPRADFLDQIGWLLRGWLVDVLPADPVLDALRLEAAAAVTYAHDEELETPPNRALEAENWSQLLAACAGLTWGVSVSTEAVRADSGTILRQAASLFRRTSETERWLELWWGRFRALWPVAHPIWRPAR